jgi:hypothetical protein
LAALSFISLVGGALSQAPSEAPARTIDTTNSTALSPEKQAQVRESLRQYESITKGDVKLPRIEQPISAGATLPEGIEPVALPQDRVTDVPQVTSYRFFVAQNGIAVVNPETKQVVQVIPGP